MTPSHASAARAQYVMKNPHTFITRFYGMHRLKMNYLGRKLHFVVMQSVFEGDQAIHETYDLKVTPTPTYHRRLLT